MMSLYRINIWIFRASFLDAQDLTSFSWVEEKNYSCEEEYHLRIYIRKKANWTELDRTIQSIREKY